MKKIGKGEVQRHQNHYDEVMTDEDYLYEVEQQVWNYCWECPFSMLPLDWLEPLDLDDGKHVWYEAKPYEFDQVDTIEVGLCP